MSAIHEHQPVQHNEVIARLWPWDVTHIVAADLTPQQIEKYGSNIEIKPIIHAIQSAIVIASLRYKLARELLETGPQKGLEHPLLLEWLQHQYSLDSGLSVHSQAETQTQIAQLTDQQKIKIILDLCSKLMEKVSVIAYKPGDTGFRLLDLDLLQSLEIFRHFRKLAEEQLHEIDSAATCT